MACGYEKMNYRYFKVVCCHPLYVKSQSNHVTWMSYSLLHETKKKKNCGRDTVSRALSVSAIRDGVKHGQMRFLHSFIPNPKFPSPPPAGNTVCFVYRAPKRLGAALPRMHWILHLFIWISNILFGFLIQLPVRCGMFNSKFNSWIDTNNIFPNPGFICLKPNSK